MTSWVVMLELLSEETANYLLEIVGREGQELDAQVILLCSDEDVVRLLDDREVSVKGHVSFGEVV